jgi:predicted secreted protein
VNGSNAPKRIERLVEQLHDSRSRRVIFLSHCLLNENTRYLGGACHAGCVPEVVERCVADHLGMVQMPCPEQRAWGGVLKPMLLAVYGLRYRSPLLFLLRRPLLALFLWHTRRVYRELARRVAAEVTDYVASGMEVTTIVGVDGSPSCGVSTTLHWQLALEVLARLRPASLTVDTVNGAVRAAAISGEGLFTAMVREELLRRGLYVRFSAHDLLAELNHAELAVP